MKPEYIPVDQIEAILHALEELKGSVSTIGKSVAIMEIDLAHVKEQTTRTNGRVDGLEDREAKHNQETAYQAGVAKAQSDAKGAAKEWIKPLAYFVLAYVAVFVLQNAPVFLRAAGK